jgi:hypothetical protein
MVHCPECGTPMGEATDLEFLGVDATPPGGRDGEAGFYIVACDGCGAAIGTGTGGPPG